MFVKELKGYIEEYPSLFKQTDDGYVTTSISCHETKRGSIEIRISGMSALVGESGGSWKLVHSMNEFLFVLQVIQNRRIQRMLEEM